MRLEGKRTIVTGGGAGIGAAIVAAFVQEGARVVVVDVDKDAGEKSANAARAEGGEAHSIECNVSDGVSVRNMIDRATEMLGGIDVLINNAGVGTPGKILDTSEADWDRMMSINVKGPFLVTKHALPHLLHAGGGSIINMGSVAGLVGIRDRSAYCTTKGGIISLTRSIAVDYVADGIRCNAICPGTVDTPWVDRMVSTYPDPEETRRGMIARQPMGRLGRPDEIARAAVYLASEDAAFVTGTCFVIDGGLTMQ